MGQQQSVLVAQLVAAVLPCFQPVQQRQQIVALAQHLGVAMRAR